MKRHRTNESKTLSQLQRLIQGVFSSDRMLMRTLCSLLGYAVLLAPAASAQQTEINVNSRPSSDQIRAWLASGEPRLIAWGAHFARESADNASTSAMVHLLEQGKEGDSNSDSAASARLGISEVLDALIVRNQVATPLAILSIAPFFPNDAMILASKLPAEKATPLLLRWYEDRRTDKQSRSARIAAMFLSKSPPPGFAASILAETEVQLSVEVTLSGGYGSGGSVGSCGDGGGGAPREGWPPLFYYLIEENGSRPEALTLVAAGGDRITYSRVSVTTGWGSCFDLYPLTAETRLHLLAEMLGIKPAEMLWKVHQQASITWVNDDQYLHELHDAIAQEEAMLHSTVAALRAKGLLTAAEVNSVRTRLGVSVRDDRGIIGAPLPHLQVSDARTFISYLPRSLEHPASGKN